MPPLNIQKDLIKPQPLEMGDECLRENFSQHQLVQHSVEADVSSENIRTTGTRRGLTKEQIITVAILCFVNLINYMDRYTVAGLLYDIGKAFDLTDGQKGLLQTAFIVVYMFMAPLYGYLGDRFNRRLLMCSGVFLWSFTTLLGSFMPNYHSFLLMRCFVGIGEASYSTIAPTIISDYFVADTRSKMLAVFYFAIPVGSGLGYIVGSKMGDLASNYLPPDAQEHAWRWGLRVTPLLGLIAVLLIFFVLREPPRGEVEGAQHLKATSFYNDLKSLITNRSYVFSTIAFTCVTYVAGALAWWGPIYVRYGAEVQTNANVDLNNIALVFGFIAMMAGIIGVPLGSFSGQKLRVKYPAADPLVCAVGLLISIPLTMVGILFAGKNTIIAFVIVFFGQIFLNLNWAVVSDMILYIVLPTRRSSATAFQILCSHGFGDAGSPYIVGLVAEAFKPFFTSQVAENFTISDNITSSIIETTIIPSTTPDPNDNWVQFKSLQYSLVICTVVQAFGALFFFWTAAHIRKDKERCNLIIAGEASPLEGSNNSLPPQPINRYADDTNIEQTHQLIT